MYGIPCSTYGDTGYLYLWGKSRAIYYRVPSISIFTCLLMFVAKSRMEVCLGHSYGLRTEYRIHTDVCFIVSGDCFVHDIESILGSKYSSRFPFLAICS